MNIRAIIIEDEKMSREILVNYLGKYCPNVEVVGMAKDVREGLEFETTLESDTQYVGDIALDLIEQFGGEIKFLRDPTRGGLATVLNEIASKHNLSIELEEQLFPILPQARSACELLGLDPIYVANEGIFATVVSPAVSAQVIQMMSNHEKCEGAAFIGKVTAEYPKKVIVKSAIGGRRVVSMLVGEQLPRIC